MGETKVGWIEWARGIRRRWTCRRVSRMPLDLVWLRLGRGASLRQASPSPRPLALRMSIVPSIAIEWVSRILALSDHVRTVRERHIPTTMIVRALATLGTRAARVPVVGVQRSASDGLKAIPYSESAFDNRSESLRSPQHTVAAPVTLRMNRSVDARGSLVAVPSLFHASAALRWTRVAADAGRFATVPMTAGRTRVEPRVVAPPPMVGRMSQRAVVSSGSQARPEMHESHQPFGFATGERTGWLPAAGALAVPLSPAVLASVTDHVVREIDSRVRAKRERLGKV